MEELQVTHGEVGGWLAERWNLPDHLTEAISLHHTPGLARRNKELVALIHCADVFCTRILEGGVEFDRGITFDPDALRALKLDDPEVFNRYLEDYRSAIQQDIDQVTTLSNAYMAIRR